MILFDSRDSGGVEKWSVARGEAEGVTRGISYYLFYFTSIMIKLR